MRTLLVALSLCLAAGSAGAQTQPAGVKTPAERFAAADANKDGKVDKAEFTTTLIPDAKPYVEAIWQNRDTNRDGWLTQDEMTTNGPAPRVGPPVAAGDRRP